MRREGGELGLLGGGGWGVGVEGWVGGIVGMVGLVLFVFGIGNNFGV